MAQGQPVLFQTVNDVYVDSARIAHVVWEGATSIGDQVEIRDEETNALIWAGRAADVHTYQGMNLGPDGVGASKGFRATVLDAGRVLVYLKEH